MSVPFNATVLEGCSRLMTQKMSTVVAQNNVLK